MGKHQCQPVGFKGHEVDYNQIDDRKCDCCDGSDERRGATCPDRCREGALAQLVSPFRGSDSRPKKPKLTGAYRQASGTQGRLRARGHRR